MSPAKSKVQQKAAGMALSVKRGKMPMSKLKGAAREMAITMTEKQLEEMAETHLAKLPKRKGLPNKSKTIKGTAKKKKK